MESLGERPPRLTVGFGPSLGQEDCVYANRRKAQRNPQWVGMTGREGHFWSSSYTYFLTWLVPFCIQKWKCWPQSQRFLVSVIAAHCPLTILTWFWFQVWRGLGTVLNPWLQDHNLWGLHWFRALHTLLCEHPTHPSVLISDLSSNSRRPPPPSL